MKYIKVLVIFPLLSLLIGASISGFIRDKNNGEPLAYTNIILLENDIGTAADVSGYYIFPIVDDGKHTMRIMMIGYKTLEREITVQDINLRIDIELEPTALDFDQVTVSAERMRFEKRVDISRMNLTNREIRRAPAFIEADIFRTLQFLPSVSASNDFNAALIVRGGSPDENLILLDGTEIYNPYHIGGVFSTFNADMISDSEFLAGGFPSKYGGRLSSVLNITAREGDSKNGRLPDSLYIYDVEVDWPWNWNSRKRKNNLKKYWDFSKGSGNISLLSAKFLAEGALYNGSWMISGRRTYFDKFVSLYYDYRDEEEPGNYYFWDTHIKMKTSINQNNQLIYSQFSGKDNLALGLEGLANIDFDWDWGNRTQNLSWRYIPNSNYIVTTRLSKTQYNFDVDFEIDFNPSTGTADTSTTDLSSGSTDLDLFLDNLVEDVDLNQNIKFIITDDISFDAGWQIKNLNLDYKEIFSGQQVTSIQSQPKIYSSFINMTLKTSPLLYINPGIRVSKYNRYDKMLINPTLGIKFNPISDLALKASVGRYSQFLFTVNQENELLRIVDFWQPIPDGEKPQEADHLILGSEYWISTGNTISLETYYKSYSSIYDLNPAPDYANIEETFSLSGTAEAYGVEFLYRFNKNKLSGWVSYAFSNIRRSVDLNSDTILDKDKEIYPAKYDKPHTFNSLLSYQINEKYSLGLSATFGSGQTYTPVIGKVHQGGVRAYGSLENPYSNFGNIYGVRNGARYPNYFRTDISLGRKSKVFGLDGELKFQVINITNHYNVLLYLWDHKASPSKVEAYSMFPIILTFGWEFKI